MARFTHTATLRGQTTTWALAAIVTATLAACGGGSDDTTATCKPFTDSFGKPVSCEEMRQLSGSEKNHVDGGGDASSGAGDAGADGSGADGAAIANMVLEFVDINGTTVFTKTDANGYYRINLRGMKAPLVATVKRDGKPWKSMLVQDIVRAPANRQFYTINLTGLTDVVASEVAKKAGLSGADALTPAAVSAQKAAVPTVIASVNQTIATQLTAAGLDPAKFDPLKTPFVPNQTGYDKVLETVTINRTSNGSTTLIPTVRSVVCTVPSFSGASQPGGAAASMTVASDGGYCTVALMADRAQTIPAYNGAIQAAPKHGTVVFSDNRVYYTPSTGYVGNDSFSYTMDGVVNGVAVKLQVNMTVTVQAAPAPTPPTSGNILTAQQLRGDLSDGCTPRDYGTGTSSNTIATLTPNADGTVSVIDREYKYATSENCTGTNTLVSTRTGTLSLTGSKQIANGLTVQKIVFNVTSPIASSIKQVLYPESGSRYFVGSIDGAKDADGYPTTLETTVSILK